MTNTRKISLLILVFWIGLAFYLVFSIRTSIKEKENISRAEATIIDRLILIREAEIAYLSVNGSYTSSWDTLKNFIDSGYFYLTEKQETIITLPYGKDSIIVNIDTLGTVSVKDSLFNITKKPKFDLANFEYVPGVEPPTKFDIWAGTISKAGVIVNVIEVKNPKPIDPDRSEDSERTTKLPLRFGSKYSVTTSGNWE